ncbi:cytochrome b/b6 domain-containing protein [Hydrogenophaga sp.]|uniref:cytochrome b/b6 domain-containing protein n=1 Tax=Hydrogenophaga sp. TaxID=1904254 RepID=UPI0027227BBA|nr:cytochrome b/b6 domain-containing protein [Hydrogenophaga sp.]MDO9438016.1 cytochrome b/b6 domain-containing protein [Hydrogenophaga sp.]
MHTIRVWDLPTRLFHWLLAAAVIGMIVTGSIGGNAMNWHLRLGYAVLTLLLFRLVWGFIGGHWSRFTSFIYAPSSLWAHLRGRGRPEHQVGHSPLGALSVFAFLAVLLVQVGTGLVSDDEIAVFGPLVRFVSGDTVALATGYHKNVGKLIVLVLVGLHVLAIGYYKWVKKLALVKPMLAGDKQVPVPVPSARDTAGTRVLALAVLGLCAAAVTWLVSLGNAL